MELREYTASDRNEVICMIKSTIRSINIKDYSMSQIEAWSNIDENSWDSSIQDHIAVVMIDNNIIVGFGDMTKDGYLDRLFIHENHQRHGIANTILDYLELHCESEIFYTHSSITARPFFERKGYEVIKEEIVDLRGESFLRYWMQKK